MSRPAVTWKFKHESLRLSDRTLLAGAIPLNTSDAGSAAELAFKLADQGADIVEIQCDVWQPGNAPVSADAEAVQDGAPQRVLRAVGRHLDAQRPARLSGECHRAAL